MVIGGQRTFYNAERCYLDKMISKGFDRLVYEKPSFIYGIEFNDEKMTAKTLRFSIAHLN